MRRIVVGGAALCLSAMACNGPYVPARGDDAGATGGQVSPSGSGGLDTSASGGATPGGTGGVTAGTGGMPAPDPAGAGSGGIPAGAGGAPGSGGGPGSGGVGGAPTTGGGGSGALAADGLPCDVAMLVQNRCISCHGTTPLPSLPTLVTYRGLTAAATSDPTRTNAQVAVTRMQSTQAPMPPAGSPAATAAEIAAMQAWIAAGYPMGSCGSGAGGAGGAGGTAPDPFSVPPTCTSKKNWTGGTEGSKDMQPGAACIACHASSGGEAPSFAVAGTLYPTAHEPNECYGTNGTSGARVVITGANGKVITLTPGTSGNFYYQGTIATPYTAKVTDGTAVRVMGTAQTTGDCNACHTQSGTNNAPGRIILP